jgi:branched-chain amino acid transport system ATP-binding protein
VILSVAGLEVAYGTQPVLFGVSLDVDEGTVTAVLGPNGAGKTTLLRAISGLLRPRAGTISFAGQDLAGADPAQRVALGIVQVAGVFPSLTVGDNLLAGCHRFAWDAARVRARVDDVLGTFPVLGERLDQPAGTLSGGEQQMLAVGKALLLEPRLLLVDELTLGLAPVAVADLLEAVRALRRRGTTMIVVEQSVNVALSIADTAAVMEKGRITLVAPAASLVERDDLVETVFLGRGT